MKHAVASPSKAAMWLACANSLAANVGQAEGRTTAANLGTDKHELMTLCLREHVDAGLYLGRTFGSNIITQEFADDVQRAIDWVRSRIHSYVLLGASVQTLLDTAVCIERITGEEGATGTLDIALLVTWPKGRSLVDIIDAKFGHFPVDADNNPQLTMYASGVLEEFDLAYDFDRVNLVIAQPSVGMTEYETTPRGVRDWSELVAAPAAKKAIRIYNQKVSDPGVALLPENYKVTEKGCKWCNAKAGCSAYQEEMERVLEMDFPPNDLAYKFSKVPLVEEWVKAIRATATHVMLSGGKLSGLKVVKGREGNRSWISEEDAAQYLRQSGLKEEQIYSKKMISPTQALKLGELCLDTLVTRKEAELSIVAESDKRPAVDVPSAADGFETID